MDHFTDNFTHEREVWKTVEIFGIVFNRYKVSNTAKVYDNEKGRFLDPSFDAKTGFMSVSLRTRTGRYKNFLMHRLVFEVFNPEEFAAAVEKKWQILHKDGNIRKNEYSNLMPAPRHVVKKQRTQEISKIRR